VHDLVKDKLTVGFDFLGPRSLKNLANEVSVYRVMQQGAAAPIPGPPRVAPGRPTPMSPLARRLLLRAATPALLIAALFLSNVFTYDGNWWFQWPALAILFVLALRAIWKLKREE
jgi:hypothetical protein